MLTKNQIRKIKWYKQSGAGIPLTIGMPVFVLSKYMYKRTKFCFPNSIAFFLKINNGYHFYHYFDRDLTKIEMKKIFKQFNQNPNFFKRLEKDFYLAGKKIQQISDKILKSNNIKRLDQFYQKFLDYNIDFWSDSLFLDFFDPFEDEVLNFIFGKKLKEISKKDIHILMSPNKMMHLQKEQKNLLDAYKKIKNGKITEQTKNLAEKISKKYYWIQNDYEKVRYSDQAYYLGQLKNLLNHKSQVKEIQKSLDNFKKIQTKKKQIIKKYKLDKGTLHRLNFCNWTIIYRDERKKYGLISNYILIDIIKKLSKDLKIKYELLNFVQPQELRLVFDRDKDFIQTLESRNNNKAIFVSMKKGKNPEIKSGQIVKDYFNIIEKSLRTSKINGNIACSGKATGTVKIVLNQKDFSKMRKNDILVAPMTRPEYLPVMKKASAIITDEGGITGHAAIVSRELNIPCIIGTQTATKVLKDGDLVEVDANRGVVKIIKRKGK